VTPGAIEEYHNSGGPVALESGKDARVANVHLHIGARYRTRIELPIRVG
jgi:hypothetical protein